MELLVPLTDASNGRRKMKSGSMSAMTAEGRRVGSTVVSQCWKPRGLL